MKRFALKALPYSHDALAPVMSSRTVEAHHDGHQAEHAAKLNQLIDNTSYAHEDLELIIFHTRGDMRCRRIFDNAAQLWNHEFFWESLSPDSGSVPSAVSQRLVAAFGSLESFRVEMVEAAVNHFGNGWVWLTGSPSGMLNIDATHDADNPFLWGAYPLFVCDLWEHAYYLDYAQNRGEFVRAVVDRLINWENVSLRLALWQDRCAAARQSRAPRLPDTKSNGVGHANH